jgi:hypothetical protein
VFDTFPAVPFFFGLSTAVAVVVVAFGIAGDFSSTTSAFFALTGDFLLSTTALLLSLTGVSFLSS